MDLQENKSSDPNQMPNNTQDKSKIMEIQILEDSPEADVQRLPVSNSQIVQNPPQIQIFSIRSEPALMARQQKLKKRKVRAYVQDFSDFLPESLLIINKTVIPPIVKIGDRYQVKIPNNPPFKSLYRPMDEWLIWNGSSNPESKPNSDHLLRFKQLLGENRTQQQFINIRTRLGFNSWKQALQHISRNKGELRRIFHVAQRNRS